MVMAKDVGMIAVSKTANHEGVLQPITMLKLIKLLFGAQPLPTPIHTYCQNTHLETCFSKASIQNNNNDKNILIRKSKDYVYSIWVYNVLGIWKGYLRTKKYDEIWLSIQTITGMEGLFDYWYLFGNTMSHVYVAMLTLKRLYRYYKQYLLFIFIKVQFGMIWRHLVLSGFSCRRSPNERFIFKS